MLGFGVALHIAMVNEPLSHLALSCKRTAPVSDDAHWQSGARRSELTPGVFNSALSGCVVLVKQIFELVALSVGDLRLSGKVVFHEELAHLVVAPGVPDLVVGGVEDRPHGFDHLVALAGDINSGGVGGVRGSLKIVFQKALVPGLEYFVKSVRYSTLEMVL